MFHDRVLNWSFAASVCANLVLVSLVGGSDLLRYSPVPIPPVIRHPPFFWTTPPPVVKTQRQPIHPACAHPLARPVAHADERVAARVPAHPVRLANLTTGTHIRRASPVTVEPVAEDAPPTSQPMTATGLETNQTVQPGNGNGGGDAHTLTGGGSGPTSDGTPDTTKATSLPAQDDKKTETPLVTRHPALADRTDPKALTEWADIASSVQFDPQSLISGVIKVQFEVDATGIPSHVEVIRSCGIPELDRSAADACRAMRFLPAVQDGVARTVTYEHDFIVSN